MRGGCGESRNSAAFQKRICYLLASSIAERKTGDEEVDVAQADVISASRVCDCPYSGWWREEEEVHHLYIIAEGQVYLERSMDIGTRKGSVVIETLGKGRVLGCWSTMLNEPHILMSSAICQRSTTMLTVKGTELRDIMTQNTDLGFKILEKLCFLLRDRIQAAYGAMEKI